MLYPAIAIPVVWQEGRCTIGTTFYAARIDSLSRLRRPEHEQFRAQREQSNRDSPFFQLPAEIRLEIYKHAASKPRPAACVETSRFWEYTPSIGNFRSRNPTLHVCRQMRHETLGFMLEDRTLVTYLDDVKGSFKWPEIVGLSDEILCAATSFRIRSSFSCRHSIFGHRATTYPNGIYVDVDRSLHKISEMMLPDKDIRVGFLWWEFDYCREAAAAKLGRITKEIQKLGLHDKEVVRSSDLRKLAKRANRDHDLFENLARWIGREGEGSGRLRKKQT